MPRLDSDLLDLLKDVSRSFYLTIRVLPGKIRPQIGLTYLVARLTDTIADTDAVPVEKRLETLKGCTDAILCACQGREWRPLVLNGFSVDRPATPEDRLLGKFVVLLHLLKQLEPDDRARISTVLRTIIQGQTTDIAQSRPSAGVIGCFRINAELDQYTYQVAGCVGEFWTLMCRAHLFPRAQIEDALLLHLAIRFGKGLQLVNILRDIAGDLRLGRCYLPAAALADVGLRPDDLLDVSKMDRFRPLYDTYLRTAEGHLTAGWEYIEMIPRSQIRVRLACAWPILLGLKTLARLREENVLDQSRRVRVSRDEVKQIVRRSILAYPSRARWNRLYRTCGLPQSG